MAYSSDGQRIISGGDDWRIRIWDAETGTAIGQPLSAPIGQIKSIAYSQDGQHIVSVNADKTVSSWDVSGTSLLKTACDRLRYHPSLDDPKTDVAREAKQTCEQYVWEK
ncbi:WD40 repeat-containing protein [Chamaesiphon minutus PCC 6605]|uniref:WD40 repeat-containing protein n=1 Tax=Chamaesiphon minutus (strain ATCC 27169 / PCC 6605) TaxID=1173020 RepID=K9UCB4_CHAP6|nr:WD40 repeat-containing protein [Chamaesiphon minutus PCC 6605]